MLTLRNVTKEYTVGGAAIRALDVVNVSFGRSGFVAVLGPSGCGKTTLLNIIGGLDRPTFGELLIDGKSTAEYSRRDMDAYRSRRIGFVFQNYNLIPHQTVLGNVALALTISGAGKRERTERAMAALKSVGLEREADKLPNQLSGGQQQRVAIARAIVNDPEILLADEPTGALDSKTGAMIMELLKEVSRDRLVITVTHNAELADRFATRTIRLSDGRVADDSAPEEEETRERKEAPAAPPKMGLLTAIKLSARNLLAKIKRTALVVMAGSIGVIGVLSVLSVSTGVRDYIKAFQDDMLSGNPIEIGKTGIDIQSAVSGASLSVKAEAAVRGEFVNVNPMIGYLLSNEDALDSLFYTNEITSDYVDFVKSMPPEYYKDILLDYGVETGVGIYTDFRVSNGDGSRFDGRISIAAITGIYREILAQSSLGDYASYVTGLATGFREGVANGGYIKEQYDVVAGGLPEKSTDILVVLNGDDKLNDVLLAQLGYYTEEEFCRIVSGEEYKTRFSYDEIMGKSFTWYPNDAIYRDTSFVSGGSVVQRYDYLCREADIGAEGVELNVCGIVRPKSNLSYGALKLGFIYTEEFARYMISRNVDSKIAQNIRKYGPVRSLRLKNELKNLFGSDTMGISCRVGYMKPSGDGRTFIPAEGDDALELFIGRTNAGTKNTIMAFLSSGGITVDSGTESMIDAVADSVTMDINGVAGTYLPEKIKVFPISFDAKDLVTGYLELWNGDGDVVFSDYPDDMNAAGTELAVKTLTDAERKTVKPSDQAGIMIEMMNSVNDAVTYALVAFTALALLVSTVMIGILTYISVIERTREIGVIRSLGGRRRDVSRLFTSEAAMIGAMSGAFGAAVTVVLAIAANAVTASVSGGTVGAIARVTPLNAAIMTGVSILLTLISGLLPARAAAMKDPAVALRTD